MKCFQISWFFRLVIIQSNDITNGLQVQTPSRGVLRKHCRGLGWLSPPNPHSFSMPTPKVRSWCFTSFKDELKLAEDDQAFRYCIAATEICPDTNRRHFQGYLELHSPQRLGRVQRIIGDAVCHCEPRRGSREQARDYCRNLPPKVGYISHTEYGIWRPGQGARCDLSEAKASVDNGLSYDEFQDRYYSISARYPRWVENYFARRLYHASRAWRNIETKLFWGPTGTGKTRKAIEDAGIDDLYIMPVPHSGVVWFNDYRGQKSLLIDEFYGQVRYSFLLRLLDGHPMMLQVKGSFTYANWTTVYITSNKSWDEWYTTVPNVDALERRITQQILFPLALAP